LSAALFLLQAAGGALAAFGGGTSSTTTRTRTTPLAMSADGVAVVGCGVLGTSLCRQILGSSDFGSRSVTGITKTSNRHESIRSAISEAAPDCADRFQLKTYEELSADAKFRDVVFCAPPSGFDDYPGAVRDAMENVWSGPSGGGSFVFTSSGGIYGEGKGETVTEESPVASRESSPRTARLIDAEQVCVEGGGCALRLAGLYLLERGAHNYWLEGGNDVRGRPDGIVNLLHYDDAASSCVAALRAGPDVVSGKTFLISDGNPTTREGICVSAKKAERYAERGMPAFLGGDDGPLGKVYDGTTSDAALRWKPQYASFDEFMSSYD